MTVMSARRGVAMATGIATLALGVWAVAVLRPPGGERLAVGPAPAPPRSSSPAELPASTNKLLDIASSCVAAATGSDAQVLLVTSPIVISDQSGSIDVPCTLKLEQAGALTLRNITLETRNLGILSDEQTVGTRVSVENSTLRGGPGASLVIFTRGSQGTVSLQGSTIDYPSGVLLTVSGAPSSLEVEDTVIKAQGESTEGIIISAWNLTFAGVRLETTSSREPFVLAEKCTGYDVVGARPRCKSVG